MARIRSIENAYNDIKNMDPGTCITKSMIRKLIIDGEIPSKRAGNKYLFDLDYLIEYLKGSIQ